MSEDREWQQNETEQGERVANWQAWETNRSPIYRDWYDEEDAGGQSFTGPGLCG